MMRPSLILRNLGAKPVQKPVSPHISFYHFYGRPLVRVFLMSSVVYYSLHYLWWYLDYDEMTAAKGREISSLQEELARATFSREKGKERD